MITVTISASTTSWSPVNTCHRFYSKRFRLLSYQSSLRSKQVASLFIFTGLKTEVSTIYAWLPSHEGCTGSLAACIGYWLLQLSITNEWSTRNWGVWLDGIQSLKLWATYFQWGNSILCWQIGLNLQQLATATLPLGIVKDHMCYSYRKLGCTCCNNCY